MKITIEYESSWRNSFLDGNNNEALPKNGRKFIGSITSLKKAENFIQRQVTLDTVMGVMNRLIGDQRKLYQARDDANYFFKSIEAHVKHEDKPSAINREMTYIRNITGSTDQNSYTGMVKTFDPMFSSDYSASFWGVLGLGLDDLCLFIINKNQITTSIDADPLSIITRLEELNKMKAISNEDDACKAVEVLLQSFPDISYETKKGDLMPISLYCSALYLQLERLGKQFDMSSAKTKAGGLSGISKRGFTKKDFMNRFTTGDKKKIWGNPYIHEEFVKGVGKIKHLMTKASGTLEINIDIERRKAREIKTMIDNAGVSSFYLGKKGLAYVSRIRV
ncbi:MAG: type I-Fv CRISPR-associated protein Cas5fv [Mariprofundaceae bacterium]|nr:type I-Fv CRISPR-associated protein Cas5fv [Mariprofundaceae bacterium]